MSEHHDPAYSGDYAQGYGDHGAEGAHGEYTDGYAHENAQYAEGYAQTGYGDEVAYGDEGPSGYSEDVAYGDEGPSGYSDDLAYGDAGPLGHGDEDPLGHDAEEEAAAPRSKKSKKAKKGKAKGGKAPRGAKGPGLAAAFSGNRKTLVLAGAGLAILAALGAGGYYVLSQGSAGAPGFDLGSITRMIPFLGPKDSDETIASGQDNAVQVKKAIDAYANEHGELPGSAALIRAQLRVMKKDLKNPYKAGDTVAIEIGDLPTTPGAIAYTLKGKGYELRVGNISGKPVEQDGEAFVLSGHMPHAGGPHAVAKLPAPRAARAPGASVQAAAGAPANVATAAHAAPAKATPATAGENPTAAPKLNVPPVHKPAANPDEAQVPAPPHGEHAVAARPSAPQPKQATKPGKPDALAGFIAKHVDTPAPRPMVGSEVRVSSNSPTVKRNQEFDRWRIQGITYIYEQKTADAVAAFKHALTLRPNDETVQRWLDVIQGVIDKHTKEEKEKYEAAKKEMLHSMPPGSLPSNPNNNVSTGETVAPPPAVEEPSDDQDRANVKKALDHSRKLLRLAPILPAPHNNNP